MKSVYFHQKFAGKEKLLFSLTDPEIYKINLINFLVLQIHKIV